MEEKEVKQIEAPAELTLEQVKEIAQKLFTENQQLRVALANLQNDRGIKRLEFLFRIVENSFAFSDEFFKKCVAEIEESLFDKEETVENTEKTENE